MVLGIFARVDVWLQAAGTAVVLREKRVVRVVRVADVVDFSIKVPEASPESGTLDALRDDALESPHAVPEGHRVVGSLHTKKQVWRQAC